MFSFTEADIMSLVAPVFWPFLRILAVFSSAPIFSARSVPMRARVALAMLVAICAQAALADQPVVGLTDPQAMGVVVQLIRLLNDALGHTSIVVSHDVHETASIADYIYVIADGEVIGEGTSEEVMNSNLPRVRQFMQGLPDGPRDLRRMRTPICGAGAVGTRCG